MTATLRVVRAGPLVTLQDAGRFGRLRFGVPASGPMDRFAHAAANLAIGNDAGATAVEVSRGGIEVECGPTPLTVSVAGGAPIVEHEGEVVGAWSALSLDPGERLRVTPGAWGSWAYLAVAGVVDVPQWLGSAATHAMSGLGGGVLGTEQQLTILMPREDADRDGSFADLSPRRSFGPVRVVLGPQHHHFVDDASRRLSSEPYTLTDSYDRMGVRLDGAHLDLGDALSIASEPIVRGSIQVAGDGVPTVLLADHQTTGGYPKIATVISCDLDRFVQLRAGDSVTFESVDANEAVAIAREHATTRTELLTQIARPGRNIARRLMQHDLIGDASAATLESGG